MKKNILLSYLGFILFTYESLAMEQEEKNITFIELGSKRSWRADENVRQPGEYDTDESKVYAAKSKKATNEEQINENSLEEDDGSFEWLPYVNEEEQKKDPLRLWELAQKEEKNNKSTI